jgi:hypothetical protein
VLLHCWQLFDWLAANKLGAEALYFVIDSWIVTSIVTTTQAWLLMVRLRLLWCVNRDRRRAQPTLRTANRLFADYHAAQPDTAT